jgi:hypothetical protein
MHGTLDGFSGIPWYGLSLQQLSAHYLTLLFENEAVTTAAGRCLNRISPLLLRYRLNLTMLVILAPVQCQR